MKKAYATIAIFLWLFAHTANAQNMYRNYQSLPNAVPRPTSAVSVVHSNQYVYFFQADGNGNLSVSEIDPLSLNPTGNDTCFQLTLQNQPVFEFYLNGGFENSIGDFVLFGYFQNYTSSYPFFPCPVYIIIPSNFASCDSYCLTTEGKYVAGCSGYNQGGQEIYVFVDEDGDLIAANAATPYLPNRISLVASSVYQDQYTDISWDEINKHFIATGSLGNSPVDHEDPFVEVFNLTPNLTINTVAEYYICDTNVTHSNEYKSLHTQIDGNNLILYHDLECYDNSHVNDIIWLTRIKNFWDINTASVDESMFYNLPNAKLFAKDMIYDPYNKRLNFLGYYNYCMDGLTQLLAQVDPYSLSSGIEIGQLGATFLGAGTCYDTTSPSIITLYNDLEMFNLALDTKNPCHPVLIAGVGNKKSLLTETYDNSLSKCDIPMWHEDYKANPDLNPYSFYVSYPPDTFHFAVANTILENVINYTQCDEPDACSHLFENKILEHLLTKNQSLADISIEANHQFVCEGFEGEIQYFLHDVAGKLLLRGITRNGEQNLLRTSNGIYLLKVKDAKGNQVVKKIVIF